MLNARGNRQAHAFPCACIKPIDIIIAGHNIWKKAGPKCFSMRICEGESGLIENFKL